MTNSFRNTLQVPQSPRQSIELDVLDANGRSLTPPRSNQMLHEIETGRSSGTVMNAIISIILLVLWPGPSSRPSSRPDHHILVLGDALHVLANGATARYRLLGAENTITKARRLTQAAVVSLIQEKSIVVIGAIAPRIHAQQYVILDHVSKTNAQIAAERRCLKNHPSHIEQL
ncbi:uncharacterized protein EAF01_006620 [Botrytis porri]|uniref:uncharacterized protein n=1 Tax=Botrytis porri TaxID=87229 RepID=UPI0019014CF7|nr:uncharacterized protein EAF01_006620 [Botrytis porri]KAF7903571.1 hypothetical protein EAF01_006620 [Botrytis porri]